MSQNLNLIALLAYYSLFPLVPGNLADGHKIWLLGY